MASITIITTIFAVCVSVECNVDAFGSKVNVPADCKDNLRREEETGKGKNYCSDKPENYPNDHVETYLKNLDFPEQKSESFYDNEIIECGEGVQSEKERNCCTLTKWETPYVVKSESTLKLVIQSGLFEQRIKTVTCADPGNNCFKDFKFLGYTAKCKPNWGSTKLYVYNSNTNSVDLVSFIFPVACSCAFIRNINIDTSDEW